MVVNITEDFEYKRIDRSGLQVKLFLDSIGPWVMTVYPSSNIVEHNLRRDSQWDRFDGKSYFLWIGKLVNALKILGISNWYFEVHVWCPEEDYVSWLCLRSQVLKWNLKIKCKICTKTVHGAKNYIFNLMFIFRS